MKFSIKHNPVFNGGTYFIYSNNIYTMNQYNSLLLDMPVQKYKEILLECGGDYDDGSRIGFSTKENAEKAFELLSPYIVMAKLVGDQDET